MINKTWTEFEEAIGTIMRESCDIALFGIHRENRAEIERKFKKIYEASWKIRHIADDIGFFILDDDSDDSDDSDGDPPF